MIPYTETSMIDFELNNFIFNKNPFDQIENCLESTGYVRIEFSPNDLPLSNIEQFFINIIEKLGGQCLTHNQDKNSFIWHVHPKETNSNEILARSQTFDEFSFHTDCSYEENPPEYMALFVLEEDQYGGGQLEIISLEDILKQLSDETKEILFKKKFQILIPNEFRKCSTIDHINALILFEQDKIRFRSDILFEKENQYFNELISIINQVKRFQPKLSQYSMIILNNQKYLHGRTQILDSRRHLLRIRFNRSVLFDIHSIYDRNKFQNEYLFFSNNFYDYFEEQFVNLNEILKLIFKEYFQPTDLGEFIRQTFNFHEKIQWILNELNISRPEFSLGTYRPDILFTQGDQFRINGKYSFEPKICEINARFPFNGYFLSASLCSNDQQNLYSNKFQSLIETIIQKSDFDLNKNMFILKSKEQGYDIHLFQQYWQRKSTKQCIFIDPIQLIIENDDLIDKKTKFSIEQCVFELHQDEILNLSKSILEYFIRNKQIKYLNDFRTIFILHDKRLLSILSNEQFIYSLLNKTNRIIELIPKTFLIKNLSNYFQKSILETKQNWIVKANSSGKGDSIYIGKNLSENEWINLFSDKSHQQWIVQQYFSSIQYQTLNLSGMLFCFDRQTFNLGIIRLSSNDIVNISHGGFYIRPYIHRSQIHSNQNQTILTKDQLHQQLSENHLLDSQWNQSVYISSSGGSGGKRLFFLTDIKQNQLQRKILVDLMIEENILSQKDICLNLFQMTNIYRSGEIFNDFCTLANSTTIPMGANANDQDILEVIQYFQPNILMGSPYRLMQLAFFIEKQENCKIKFEKIFFACESLNKIKRDYFNKIFNCSIFLGFYGSAETGVFACQSNKYSSTNIYLYPKSLVQIEIINSKILVTNLIRTRNQLIRFDTGDLGELIQIDNLNSNYGLIQVLNSQRLIMIENNVLSKNDFELIMKQFDLIEWQIVIDYVSCTNQEQISILFRYVKQLNVSDEFIQENIRMNIQKYFQQSIQEKLIIQFQSISFEQLFRNQISNKLLKIIDKRL